MLQGGPETLTHSDRNVFSWRTCTSFGT